MIRGCESFHDSERSKNNYMYQVFGAAGKMEGEEIPEGMPLDDWLLELDDYVEVQCFYSTLHKPTYL